jgi:acetyltransferase
MGIHVDPDFGPLCMLGRGGVDIEETGDVTFRTIPVAPEQAAAMLEEFDLPIELDDIQCEAVVEAVVSLSELYLGNTWIREGDVNPLLVTPGGVTAVDGLFVGPDESE